MINGLVTFKTDLGWMGILAAEGRIQETAIGHGNRRDLLVRFGVSNSPVAVADCRAIVERFQKFCAGKKISLASLKIDDSWMTPFQKRVIDACRAIPWGETLSYGQLAEIAGSPGASRAVGTVMAKNRFPLIVPCHRVCSSSGIGGFSAPNGVDLKRRLLANEGVNSLVAVS